MAERLVCFKAYDIRGKVPDELNPDIAYRVGRALADETGALTCVIGHDVRLSSRDLTDAVARGLCDAGVEVTDIGLCGTEMVYFATAKFGFGAGVMITASHNPPEYNGMKLVREGSRPISGDSGLWEIERRVREKDFKRTSSALSPRPPLPRGGRGGGVADVPFDQGGGVAGVPFGSVRPMDAYEAFADHLLGVVPPESLKPLRVLANAGNGCAGIAVRAFEKRTPLEIEPMDFEPDGRFPKGVPNPILAESRRPTALRMQTESFAFGAAWDADYDRCFFFDAHGNFIEGYYIVGLLAQDTLAHKPGATIIHDPRLTWNTIEICERYGGRPVMCKTGHAFIKECMRAEDAEYGGEMSAHHYFKDHWFCDSGMIPFLAIARIVSQTGRPLGDLVNEMQERYPCSGEINSHVADPATAIRRVYESLPGGKADWTDGLSLEFETWRFNLRASNTEPVVRLNVESRGDRDLVRWKAGEIIGVLCG